MGAWSALLGLGIGLIIVGLVTHWSILLMGALLPFLPVIAELLRRRRKRRPPADS
jgi:hypothetical protein